ncbi:ABC transporter permease, partial [Streptomyces sp. T-3]|nr:ABC transporter permease [Streptomyces sp. T-3]
MLSIALRTLRTRWITFVGTFVALALGVGLIATMGLGLASTLNAPEQRPERFADAPLVVRGTDTLRVPTEHGEKSKQLDQPRAIPTQLVKSLAELGKTVADRSFPVRAPGGPEGLVGHPWSTAAYAPYGIGAGRAPAADNEVVVTGNWARIGDRLKTDRGPVTVVGTARDRGFEDAVFFTDARAAQISPRVDALVVDADPATVREHLGDAPAEVLTGGARHLADADPDRDKEALVAVNALLGTAAGVTGFVSVFVVASTFAFAVAQRRRELGLLRTAGATPAQIRRMVLAEALLVGGLASAAGCVLGRYGAPLLADRMVDGGVAPRWFAIGDHA